MESPMKNSRGGGRVEIRNPKHETVLKNDLKHLLNDESYWNVMLFCHDGIMAHNRLTVGLIFPQVRDEISVICPDFSMQDIADMINNTMYNTSEEEKTGSKVGREKQLLNHLLDSDIQNFVSDLGYSQNRTQEPHYIELEQEEMETQTSAEMDPLDQLCLDLAPFAKNNKECSPEDNLETLMPLELDKDDIDLSLTDLGSPFRKVRRIRIDSRNIHLQNLDNISEASSNSSDGSVVTYDNSESFGVKIGDGNIDGGPNQDSDKKQYKDSTEFMVKSILYELVEDIDMDEVNSLLGEEEDDDDFDNSSIPESTESQQRVRPSNLLFSTLGSFDDDRDIGQFQEWDETAQRMGIQDTEYIEEKPKFDPKDISSLSLSNMDLDTSNKCTKYCQVEVERHMLSPGEWVHVRKALERKEQNDKSKNSGNTRQSLIEKTRKVLPVRRPLPMRSQKQPMGKKIKRVRCGKCDPCVMEDCRNCIFCQDMKKYGGKGTKKQSCIERPKCDWYSNRSQFGKKIHRSMSEVQTSNMKIKEKIQRSISQVQTSNMKIKERFEIRGKGTNHCDLLKRIKESKEEIIKMRASRALKIDDDKHEKDSKDEMRRDKKEGRAVQSKVWSSTSEETSKFQSAKKNVRFREKDSSSDGETEVIKEGFSGRKVKLQIAESPVKNLIKDINNKKAIISSLSKEELLFGFQL